MAVQRIVFEGIRTWTVTGEDHLPVRPVEEFLDHLRVAQLASPNTVRSYATSLDRWWGYLTDAGLAWDEVKLPAFTPYLMVLRTGEPAGIRVLPGAEHSGGLAETTVAVRVAAVLSFYRYHADVHAVPVADRLYRAGRRTGRYLPGLVHLRGGQHLRPAVRLRRAAGRPMPLLTPDQIDAILDGCARWDAEAGGWSGSVRNRLLFSALAETGMRLGECLSTRHCDWHVGRGQTPFVEVVPRQDHPAAGRAVARRSARHHHDIGAPALAQGPQAGHLDRPAPAAVPLVGHEPLLTVAVPVVPAGRAVARRGARHPVGAGVPALAQGPQAGHRDRPAPRAGRPGRPGG